MNLFWTGVLTVFIVEAFFVALMSYIGSHFFEEEEDDDAGSTEKHN